MGNIRNFFIYYRIRFIPLLILICIIPLGANETLPKNRSEIVYDKKYLEKSGSIFGGGLKILELALDVSPTPSAGGPQSVNQILNSIRIASTFIDPSESPQIISESGSSRPKSTFVPRINYSQQFGDHFFWGILLANGEKYIDERTSLGSNGLFLRDRTRPAIDEIGGKIGFGPLNYLTDRFSFEISLRYSENNSNGTYDSFQLKYPLIRNSQSSTGFAVSVGQLEFKTKNYSIGSGIVFNIIDWFNLYFLYDFTFFSGDMKLSSLNRENSIQTDFDTGNNSFRINQTNRSLNEFTFLQTKKGFGNGVFGINMNLEMGFVLRIMDRLGLKLGGYYQLTTFNVGDIKGINIKEGRTPIELDSVPDFSSSLTGKQYGDLGLSFAVVKNL